MANVTAFDEVAVVVGNFPNLDDAGAQKTLDRIKHLKPRSLEVNETVNTNQRFGVWREIQRRINDLIIGAQQTARAIMKKRGAEIVLISRTGPIQIKDEKALQDEIIFRRVLCTQATVDITEDVLAAMDKWYEENKNAKGEIPEREDKQASANKDEPKKKTTKK